MNKVKTKSAAKKRFKKVGKKLVKRAHAFRRHLLTKKSANRKRALRQGAYISKTDTSRVLLMLPY